MGRDALPGVRSKAMCGSGAAELSDGRDEVGQRTSVHADSTKRGIAAKRPTFRQGYLPLFSTARYNAP